MLACCSFVGVLFDDCRCVVCCLCFGVGCLVFVHWRLLLVGRVCVVCRLLACTLSCCVTVAAYCLLVACSSFVCRLLASCLLVCGFVVCSLLIVVG